MATTPEEVIRFMQSHDVIPQQIVVDCGIVGYDKHDYSPAILTECLDNFYANNKSFYINCNSGQFHFIVDKPHKFANLVLTPPFFPFAV